METDCPSDTQRHAPWTDLSKGSCSMALGTWLDEVLDGGLSVMRGWWGWWRAVRVGMRSPHTCC